MNFEILRYNEEIPLTVLLDSELSAVSASVLFNFIAMYPPDLPSRLYASGAAKHEEESSTGQCGRRHEYNPELFVTTTASEDEASEVNPGNRNGDAFDVALPVPGSGGMRRKQASPRSRKPR